MLNKACIIGRLGQDPEIRTTTDGKEIAILSLATSDNWKDKNTGEKREKTEWHKVIIFSQNIVNIVKLYVKKGSKLYIEGKIQTRKWTDKNKIERYTTEIVLNDFSAVIQILDNKQAEPVQSFHEPKETDSDDIPF